METITLSNGTKVILHQLPPDNFIAAEADEKTLQMFGLPKKPENEHHLKIWNRLKNRKFKFIRPHFILKTFKK